MPDTIIIVDQEERTEVQLPKSWNELTLDQQLAAYGIIFENSPDVLAPQEVLPAKRLSLFLLLSGKEENFLHQWQSDCRQAEENDDDGDTVFLSELDECLSSTNLFFKQNEEKGNAYEINFALTRCPWPEMAGVPSHFKHIKSTITWHAPAFDEDTADGLSNINLYELANTFTLFERMVTEKDLKMKERLVQRLLCTLYRPVKPETPENIECGYNGDIRQPLEGFETMIKKRQPHWKFIPAPAKQLLIFWFASCRKYIIEQYPLVFKPPKGEKQNGNDFGWGGVLLELAGGLPQLQKVYKQPYQNGLIYLSRLEDQAIRRELEEKKRRLKKIR